MRHDTQFMRESVPRLCVEIPTKRTISTAQTAFLKTDLNSFFLANCALQPAELRFPATADARNSSNVGGVKLMNSPPKRNGQY
jgi:hypothetical protein